MTLLLPVIFAVFISSAYGQAAVATNKDDIPKVQPGKTLDPSSLITHPWIVGEHHTPLSEEYIWTQNDAAVLDPHAPLNQLKKNDWKVEPHAFRAWFNVPNLPQRSTLYLAGPRHVRVWVNGILLANRDATPMAHAGFTVLKVDTTTALRSGRNLIALEVVRGYGSHHHTNSVKTSWLNSGEVLVAKLLDSADDRNQQTLLHSNASWKSTVNLTGTWFDVDYDDREWKSATSLGGIESDPDFFQWNADAGLYDWPGYLGEAPYMANYLIPATEITHSSQGTIYDFGREINGRFWIDSAASPAHLQIRYGESKGELLHAPFLGDINLDLSSREIIRGPKTGFRYLLISSNEPLPELHIQAEGIYYPVVQKGNFVSNDEQLNRIFAASAYTAHLSMQDSILDGIKRDRGRWVGDDEVIHRVVADLYADPKLVRSGLEDALGTEPIHEHVNGLPGYSAWWIVAEYEYVIRWGDLNQLQSVSARMIQLLERMKSDLDSNYIYRDHLRQKPFIDWANGLSSDSPEARMALDLEYLYAFRRATSLFALLNDSKHAQEYKALSDQMQIAAQRYYKDTNGSYGNLLQSNTIAVLSGVIADDKQAEAVRTILRRINDHHTESDVITPYYGSYLLQALSQLNMRKDGLEWVRSYWGEMLKLGASSFWEAWDPAWASEDPHSRMEADDKVGYYTSLAHGWSSGPAAWMLEEIAGIQPVNAGYRVVSIRPELCDLQWIKADMATPLGTIHLEVDRNHMSIQVPAGMTVILPSANWKPTSKKSSIRNRIDGSIEITQPGRYDFDQTKFTHR